MLRDGNRTCVGGLWGRLHYDWLFIEMLLVPEQLRGEGSGSRLLVKAEEFARERGCVGVWLDTHGFQAPHFYLKQGYERFGSLADHPRGFDRIFFRKYLS
jgi:GNAT superfamily N-acetyltransferase